MKLAALRVKSKQPRNENLPHETGLHRSSPMEKISGSTSNIPSIKITSQSHNKAQLQKSTHKTYTNDCNPDSPMLPHSPEKVPFSSHANLVIWHFVRGVRMPRWQSVLLGGGGRRASWWGRMLNERRGRDVIDDGRVGSSLIV
jgi:hypothetical protein